MGGAVAQSQRLTLQDWAARQRPRWSGGRPWSGPPDNTQFPEQCSAAWLDEVRPSTVARNDTDECDPEQVAGSLPL